MKTSLFDYHLPEELIAQYPLPERDESRLMVLNRGTREIQHTTFTKLPEFLSPGDLIVINNTRVITMLKNKAYIVGVGPGSTGYLTKQAQVIIKEADIVVGWELNFLPVKPLIADKKVYLQEASNYIQVAECAADEARKQGKTVAVLKIGDPCISSGLAGTLKTFHDFDVIIVPGISSTQIAAAAAGTAGPARKTRIVFRCLGRATPVAQVCAEAARAAAVPA